MKTTEPIRNKQQVNQLLMYYFNRGQMRNFLLITLCVYTALRISRCPTLNHKRCLRLQKPPHTPIHYHHRKENRQNQNNRTSQKHHNRTVSLFLIRKTQHATDSQ